MYQVLLVDDEEQILHGYANYFPWSEAGFSVGGTAASAAEAMRMLETGSYDVLVCDIEMPGMNGIEFIEKIHGTRPGLPVIVLSGHNVFDYARKLIDYEIVAYVLKSDKHSVLLDALRRAATRLGTPRSDHEVVQEACAYIHRALPDASLQTAAEALHVSAGYLSRLFKEHMHVNFHTYVLDVKMKQACRLLIHERKRVSEVSAQLGYADTQSFIRAFKKQYGKTPVEYVTAQKTER